MSIDRSNLYYQQLAAFNNKAEQEPDSENVQIQKVSSPVDSASVNDQNTVTFTVGRRPSTYGNAKYGQAEYGNYWVWVAGVLVTQGPTP